MSGQEETREKTPVPKLVIYRQDATVAFSSSSSTDSSTTSSSTSSTSADFTPSLLENWDPDYVPSDDSDDSYEYLPDDDSEDRRTKEIYLVRALDLIVILSVFFLLYQALTNSHGIMEMLD